MNVYDFDDTIFDGDSSKLFLVHCLREKWLLAGLLPLQAASLALNKARLMSIEKTKSTCFSCLRAFGDRKALLERFREREGHRLTAWYLGQAKPDDVIISASPAFLISALLPGHDPTRLICTRMDINTGRVEGRNCKGTEKIARFRALFPEDEIDSFYSDSLTDRPMARLAKKAWLVDHRASTVTPFPL